MTDRERVAAAIWTVSFEQYDMPPENTKLGKVLYKMADAAVSVRAAPKVKALEWEGDFAHTGLGMFYQIDRRTSGSVPALYRITGSSETGMMAGETEEVMKAAAQADFERRILDALE